MRKYNHKKVERTWQKQWAKENTYATSDRSTKPTQYVLDMFPYPSGEGLHVGHPKGYIATDIYSRFQRMNGHNVLHPMGWDAFGLPAENYAIKNNVHPRKAVETNIKRYKKQLNQIGLDYDWSREINTTDPDYYRWTQWIFLQLYKKGLAYQSYEPINWCPSCKTGLANEDLDNDGRCERCGSEVEQKPMRQWVLKITDYADRLLSDLTDLDWPESVKESQRNWIGRSEGAEIVFPINQKNHYVLLHGYTGSPEANFFPWLKRELESRGHTVEMPALPNTDNPNIEEQVKHVFDTCHFNENTILLGHSLGGVVAQIVTERLKAPIKKLVLAASFTKPEFKDNERPFANTFNWRFDFDRIRKNAHRIIVLRDENDSVVPAIEADLLAEATGGELRSFVARDEHICGTREPDVLEACLEEIKIFTTRPDTVYGATYMVLAPEHPLVDEFQPNISNREAVEKYRNEARAKTELERTSENKDPSNPSGQAKTGVHLKGVSAQNPANGEEIPIYIADYVMTGYGTGAIMAVPAHDERDWAFARAHGLPIRQVIRPVRIDKTNPPKRGAKESPREVVHCIVKHSKENKILTLKWKEHDWHTLIIGGIEEGETASDAARREIHEETGYRNLVFEGQLGDEVRAEFYAAHKDVNRIAYTKALIFRLTDLERDEISEEEKTKHEPVWTSIDELESTIHPCAELDVWVKRLSTGNYAYEGDGELVNSGEFDGSDSESVREKITQAVGGITRVHYKLNDWVFSRQRYWGEPIPIIHCQKCGPQPVPEKDLPVTLPKVDSYEPTGTGESPLAGIEEWVNTKCPACGGAGTRETNTMPQWAGSCWYYIAYIIRENSKLETRNSKQFSNLKSQKSQKRIRHWLPVDMYVGGVEHATRHLIYARFWHKFLYDIDVVSTTEPFRQLKNQGLIAGADGQKMSKRYGNVINPDEVIDQHGADSFRVYEMFMGPFEQGASWSTDNLVGSRRFIERVWRLQERVSKKADTGSEQEILLHKTIKKVTEDIETFNFNTAISAMMVLLNEFEKHEAVTDEHYKTFLQLLAPFAPHMCEELWHTVFTYKQSIHHSAWPSFDPAKTKDDVVILVVQVNGKVRDEFEVAVGSREEDVIRKALARENVERWINGKTVKRTIVVPDKLVNIVVSEDL